MRVLSIAFCLRRFADRDRARSLELLGDRIARRAREPDSLWRVQLWPSGGPYPTVNVDDATRIVYPPSFDGTRSVASTVAKPNASPSPL